MEAAETAVCLVMKTVLLSARWAGRSRQLSPEQMSEAAEANRVAALEARVAVLEDRLELREAHISVLESRLGQERPRKPYPLMERLQRAEGASEQDPREIAQLIGEIFRQNPLWGRHSIAMTLWGLGVFVAASTVRNILQRPRPPRSSAELPAIRPEAKPRQIVARYPNHIWSVDRTRVWRWRIWPTWVLVAIDDRPLLPQGRRLLSPGGAQRGLGSGGSGERVLASRSAEAHHQ